MDILIAQRIEVRGFLPQLLDLRTDCPTEDYQFEQAGSFTVLVTRSVAVREEESIYVFDGQCSSEGAVSGLTPVLSGQP